MDLDTFHDRRNGYLFYISPVGGMFDGATANDQPRHVGLKISRPDDLH